MYLDTSVETTCPNCNVKNTIFIRIMDFNRCGSQIVLCHKEWVAIMVGRVVVNIQLNVRFVGSKENEIYTS